jgi:histidine triad (HIT) family protein
MQCIFCKIIKKEIPAEIVYENDSVLAFQDIEPIAPIHILIVPKAHISSAGHLEPENKLLAGELILAAQKISKDKKIDESGYRLIFNIGRDAGQTVDHLHMHLIGGKKISMGIKKI